MTGYLTVLFVLAVGIAVGWFARAEWYKRQSRKGLAGP